MKDPQTTYIHTVEVIQHLAISPLDKPSFFQIII